MTPLLSLSASESLRPVDRRHNVESAAIGEML